MSTITSVRDPNEACYQEIVSRIYLGSCEAFTKEIITEKRVTHVLSLGDFSNDLDLAVEYKVRSRLGSTSELCADTNLL